MGGGSVFCGVCSGEVALMDDEFRKRDYETSAKEFWRWRDAGDDLLIASKILEESYEKAMEEVRKSEPGKFPLSAQVLPQFIYFKAKSLELYLKSLYIKQGNEPTENGKLTSELKSHNLLELCNKTNFQHEKSVSLLNKLTNAIVYWGTYPIPLSWEYWRPNQKLIDITGIQPLYIWAENENQKVNLLLDRLRKLLD